MLMSESSPSFLRCVLPLLLLLIKLLCSTAPLLIILVMADASNIRWVEMEPEESNRQHLLHPLNLIERADLEYVQACTFRLIGKNKDQLKQLLSESSNPKSRSYGKRMSKAEIDAMTTDYEGNEKITAYLNGAGANITKQTPSSISAEAPLSIWESLLHTEFFRTGTQIGAVDADGRLSAESSAASRSSSCCIPAAIGIIQGQALLSSGRYSPAR